MIVHLSHTMTIESTRISRTCIASF